MIAPRRACTAIGLLPVLFLVLSGAQGRAGTVARPWEEDQEPERTPAIYGILGAGTPVGIFGLEMVFRLRPSLELSAGVGLGGSASGSQSNSSIGREVQWAVMPRWLFGDATNRLTLGTGLSGGQYGGYQIFGQGLNCPEEGPCSYETRYTLWLNVEVGGEHWSSGGLAFRYFFGIAGGATLDPFALSIHGQPLAIPYVGVGLGWAYTPGG